MRSVNNNPGFKPENHKKQVKDVKTLILLGENSVGKTSILKMLTKGIINDTYLSTICVNYYEKEIIIDDEKIIFSIWDTNGGEKKVHSLPDNIYRKSDLFIIVLSYDIKNSLNYIKDYFDLVRNESEKPAIFIVVNKSDLEVKTYRFEDVKMLLDDYHESIHLSELCAKNQRQVERLFKKIGMFLLGRNVPGVSQRDSDTAIVNLRNSFRLNEEDNNGSVNNGNDHLSVKSNRNRGSGHCC